MADHTLHVSAAEVDAARSMLAMNEAAGIGTDAWTRTVAASEPGSLLLAFELDPADRAELDLFVAKHYGGDRNAFLRDAMRVMKQHMNTDAQPSYKHGWHRRN